ncbi:OmpA family protein [Myxococcota bacterium]|nr:OmpA family protein [Myxococcota bacterium]MBU1899589.1 OmpA family protein [Myxococcota bacterium]
MQNFKPAVGTWNLLSVEGGQVAKHLTFVPHLYLSYANQPLVVRDENDKVIKNYVEHLGSADLMLVLGLADRLELGLGLPFVYVSGDVVNEAGNDGVALGDIRFLPKLRLFGLEPGSEGPGVGIAIAAPVTIPTGDKDKYISSDQLTVNPKLILEARGVGFSFMANGGVRFRPEKKKVENLELDHEITYGAGVKVLLGTKMVEGMAEVFGAAPITDIRGDSRSSPLEGLLGFRFFTTPGPVFTIGGGTGIIADYGSPVYRLILGMAWHKRDYDRDKDGILDDVDQCPDEPEDKDQFEDSDGCPDLDNDQDTILDVNDRCPLDKEDIDKFEDEDGCPDPDNDQDGLLDVDDQCPDQPETKNNYKDTDGCPDEIPDTDGDGIKDPQDKCPTDPEDIDQFEDEDGCPDPDNDKDGILDDKDKCRNDPEVVNGFEDEDGCPDQSPKLKLVKVTKEKIEILQKVFFNTNKTTIKRQSFAVLNEVAEVLKSYKHIKKVRVEGHTDSQGNDNYNLKLSKGRADSVMKYLMSKGVEAERLEFEGYGETVPIDDNKTAAGRANNRRVEFTILDQ